MERERRAQDGQLAGPAAEPLRRRGQAAAIADRRPAAAAQRALNQAAAQRATGPAEPEETPAASTSTGSGLPAGLRTGVEQLSGVSMAGVSVHYNSSRPAQLNALAFAQGNEIHLGRGQESHLPHEAWHLAQQAQGRVQPTTAAGGVPVNDDPSLETEADRMGEAAQRAGQVEEPEPSR